MKTNTSGIMEKVDLEAHISFSYYILRRPLSGGLAPGRPKLTN